MSAVEIAIAPAIRASELETHEGQDRLVEVVNGIVRDKAMAGELHGYIETNLILLLGNHVLPKQLGRVYTGDTTYVLKGTPEAIEISRLPDVSFVRQERLQPSKGFQYLAPDVAIEIISPSESAQDLADKVEDYLTYGTQQVWVVYPNKRRIVVYQPDRTSTAYRAEDTLNANAVIPGLSFLVAQVFD